LRPIGSAGLAAGPRWAEADRVGSGLRARPKKKGIVLFLFSEFFNAKTIPEVSRNCFKGTKNTQKITKNPGKFPEAHWDMNNPNKVFGAHEKILEPSNK
jgi:hypothetical protein